MTVRKMNEVSLFSRLVIVGLQFGLLSGAQIIAQESRAANSAYAVSQTGNLVMVKSPWGSQIYIAPVGFDTISSYEFSIPLSEFRSNLAGGGLNGSGGAEGRTGAGNGNQVTPMNMNDASSLIAEANRLYNTGDFTKALEYVDEANRREPGNVRVWVMKGSLMHAMGHDDLSKQAYKKALDLDPDNVQLKSILQETK